MTKKAKAKAMVQVDFEVGDNEVVGKTISVSNDYVLLITEFAIGRIKHVAAAIGGKPIWSTARICHGGRCKSLC